MSKTNNANALPEPANLSIVTVKPVHTRRQRRSFLNLPWRIYRDSPQWIPPLRGNQAELVGYRRHPFYMDAEIQTFLAYRGSEICGRIAAIDNHVHNRTYPDDPRGFVGFFESIDDQTVAAALFDAARKWLEQRNLHCLRGPTNPSINYEWGLLIDAFDKSPTFLMTYNPPYYARLWEGYGFQKTQDMYSYCGHKDDLANLKTKISFIVDEARNRFDIRIRCLNKRRFSEEVRNFLNLYNKALVGTWGFIPLSAQEVDHFSRSLRHLLVPELALVAEIDGEMAGVMLGLLDYNPRIREIDGRLLPFGFWKLLRKRREMRRVRLVSTNVLPEYQRWGVGVVLAVSFVDPALKWGVSEGEFSWVLESNHLSRKTLEKGGFELEKTHRVYDLESSS
jgi:GNAT superfamily N-acetyltransferase